MSRLRLHGFFRSGTSYRTRICLNLKGLTYENVPVLLNKAEHRSPAFAAINPSRLVPALEVDGVFLTQSPAIIEYLEEAYPEPPLLPTEPLARARVRALAAVVGCDIHPINNLRVLNALRQDLGQSEENVTRWTHAWIEAGFSALEEFLRADGDRRGFCFGDAPTLADAYLIPQIYSARRFGVDLTPYPQIVAVDANCVAIPAFVAAHPDRQSDAF